MTINSEYLKQLSPDELDDLYRQSSIGNIPNGKGEGNILFFTQLPKDNPLPFLIKLLVWQGKVFYRDQGFLLNRMSPFDLKLVKASVYSEDSWLAEGNSIILDYSKTSFVAQAIRDEIREVATGLYLGQAYWDKTRVLCFSLEF